MAAPLQRGPLAAARRLPAPAPPVAPGRHASSSRSRSRPQKQQRASFASGRGGYPSPEELPERVNDPAFYLTNREQEGAGTSGSGRAAPRLVRVRLNVHYRVHSRQMLCIGGSQIPFGWSFLSISKVPMTWNQGDVWTCEVCFLLGCSL